MCDHGEVLTYFEGIFGKEIEHEVIKMVLQSCNWESNVAKEKLLSLCPSKSARLSSNAAKETGSNDTLSPISINNLPNTLKDNERYTLLHGGDNENKISFVKNVINKKATEILVIMRGLPGSGKTTLANSLVKGTSGVILSTDDYFSDQYGNYDYSATQLPEAHRWNKERAKLAMSKRITPIIIDNTNLQIWELEPYVQFAIENNYIVEFIEPQTTWKYNLKDLLRKNTHKVDKQKLEVMLNRFEKSATIEDVIQRIEKKRDINYNDYRKLIFSVSSSFIEENEVNFEKIDSNQIQRLASGNDTSSFIVNNDFQSNIGQVTNTMNEASDVITEDIFVDIAASLGTPVKKDLHNKSLLTSEDNEYEDYQLLSNKEPVSLMGTTALNNADQKERTSHCDSSEPSSDQNISKTSLELTEGKPQGENLKSGRPCKWITHTNDSGNKEDQSIAEWAINSFNLSSWEKTSLANKEKSSWREGGSSAQYSHTGAIPKQPRPEISFHNRSETDSKSKVEICTQVNFSDLTKIEDSANQNQSKVIIGNSSRFIPGSSTEYLQQLVNKSSMTEDILEHKKIDRNAVSKIMSLFPKVSRVLIKELLIKCHDDVDWVVNILMDEGYELSVTNFEDPEDILCSSDTDTDCSDGSQLNESSNSICSSNDNKEIGSVTGDDNLVVQKTIEHPVVCSNLSNDRTFHVEVSRDFKTNSLIDELYQAELKIEELKTADGDTNSKVQETDKESQDGSRYLTLEIDNLFASQLISIFGPITSLGNSPQLAPEDRRIVLPLELCSEIHQYWATTAEGTLQDEVEILDRYIRDDEELARKLQEEEYKTETESDLFGNDPPRSLAEDKALQRSIQKSSDHPSYSNVVNLSKLHEEFPYVDRSVVKRIFSECDHSYEDAKCILGFQYGKTGCPINVLPPSEYTCEEMLEDEVLCPTDPQVYREEAQMHSQERKKAFAKAQEASRNGMKAVAGYYAQIGNLHAVKFKEANERASKMILNAVNSQRDANILDLHLLHVPEALRETQSFLSERRSLLRNKKLGRLTVSIITGRGKHSLYGESQLRPAVEFFLRKEGYNYQVANEGMLDVTLLP